ncbi:FAD-binding oxidoreductase [Aliamphritea spongicola]|uniref:hybrid-cluster NAD(P)-dependent oxidoreductase n=1 Tax=Aliamphritea spongicola TaxID=707589 RepID=UPI00196A6B90|nr:hybrid-cluster NAD(P)-dependent oxidoreductase [Aliamphritea spongicola]MBN3560890.1 hybrid-cluster NAD(P)-dependent oxidoreductase [Aliamphritea spongicola]
MTDFNTADFLNPVATQTWSNGRHLVRCSKVIHETHDVCTFTFSMGQPVLFFFKPGQFVTLELEIDGERVMRSYTISSSPSIPYSFSITVKRVPGGVVSNWLHDNLKSGDQIAVHGPAGQFNCLDFPTDKALLLSGGVGITPVMSMARWWFDTDSEVDMVFAHSARSPADIIYARELDYMSTRVENFKLHLICEKSEIGQAWAGYRGYINENMLKLIAPDFLEREVFCCGPDPYMKAVRKLLESLGYDMSRYHEESFGATPVEDAKDAEQHADEADQQEVTGEMYQVSFTDSGNSVSVVAGTNLNEAASEAGVNISKACGMGICGACRVQVTSGEYEMAHNGGITEEEEAQGYVLSCCTSIQGDMTIDY